MMMLLLMMMTLLLLMMMMLLLMLLLQMTMTMTTTMMINLLLLLLLQMLMMMMLLPMMTGSPKPALGCNEPRCARGEESSPIAAVPALRNTDHTKKKYQNLQSSAQTLTLCNLRRRGRG
jgi:hypothetical protein